MPKQNPENFEKPSKSELLHQESRKNIAKLKVETNPDKALDDPSSIGLKTKEELTGLPPFKLEVKSGMNFTQFLKDYYTNTVKISDSKNVDKEVALSIYYLTQQQDVSGSFINVNNIIVNWQGSFLLGYY